MTRKNEKKLDILFAKYVQPEIAVKTITNKQRVAIKAAVKSFAYEFNKQIIESEYGAQQPYYVDDNDTLKKHAVNMSKMLSIDPHVMFGAKKGKMEVSTSRQVIMLMLRNQFGMRVAHNNVLAQLFNKDRATVYHSIKTAKSNLKYKDALTLSIHKILSEYDFQGK